jgi:hypothetical protein
MNEMCAQSQKGQGRGERKGDDDGGGGYPTSGEKGQCHDGWDLRLLVKENNDGSSLARGPDRAHGGLEAKGELALCTYTFLVLARLCPVASRMRPDFLVASLALSEASVHRVGADDRKHRHRPFLFDFPSGSESMSPPPPVDPVFARTGTKLRTPLLGNFPDQESWDLKKWLMTSLLPAKEKERRQNPTQHRQLLVPRQGQRQ